jgi:hypothetical protein
LEKPDEHRPKIRPSIFGDGSWQPRRNIQVPWVRDRPDDKKRNIGGNGGPGNGMAFGIDGRTAGLAPKLPLSLDRVCRKIDSDNAFLKERRRAVQPVQQAAAPSCIRCIGLSLKRDDALRNQQGARLSTGRKAARHAKTDQSAAIFLTCKLGGRSRSAVGLGRDANDLQPLFNIDPF